MHNATAAGIVVSLVKASCGEPSHVVVHTLERKQKNNSSQEIPYELYCLLLILRGKTFSGHKVSNGLLFFGTGTLSLSHPPHNCPMHSVRQRVDPVRAETPSESITHGKTYL